MRRAISSRQDRHGAEAERARYEANARLASFVGAFPMSTPRYVVFVMVDEPKPNAHSYGLPPAAGGGPGGEPHRAADGADGWSAAHPKDSPEAQNALLTQVSVTNAAE